MKTLKTIMAVAILSLAVSVPAHGGDMSTPAGPNPPPATISPEDEQTPTETSEPGDTTTPSGASTAPGDIETPEFAVNILLALLSIF